MPASNSTLRSTAWEWAQAGLLAVNLTWTTLCLGGFLAKTMVVTSTLTFGLVLLHAAALFFAARRPAGGEGAAPTRLNRAAWWFAPFLAYALVSVLWITPVRWLGWIDWFGWFELIAVFAVVTNGIRSRGPQQLLLATLFGVAVVAVFLGAYQHFVAPTWMMLGRTQAAQYGGRASGSFGIPNSLAALLLLLLPIAGSLTFRRGAAATTRVLFGWLTLVLLAGLDLTISRGAWIGLGLALTAWPLVAGRASWRRRALFTMLMAVGVLAVGALAIVASSSVRDRFTAMVHDAGELSRPIVWRAAWHVFREHPALGSGAGSFDVVFEKYRPEGFILRPRWAHNDYLNTLSDYGAVGFGLFFGAVAMVVLRSWRRAAPAARPDRFSAVRPFALDDGLVRQAFAVGLLAFAFQLFVDFHFKIPALALAFAVVAGVLVGRKAGLPLDAGIPAPAARERTILGVVCAVAAIGAACVVLPQYRGEAWREQANQRIDRLTREDPSPEEIRTQLDRIEPELDRAVALAPTNAQAWADRAYAMAQRSRVEPGTAARLGKLAEASANRAIALAPICAEYWVRRGVARDMQGRWAEAGDDFARAGELGPTAVLPWYHLAYHYALRETGTDMAEALTSFCLRLDPQNREALRLRQQLATRH